MISVQAPDGANIQFPDGTPQDTILGVMRDYTAGHAGGGKDSIRGLGKAALGGVNQGIADAAGIPMGIYNLVGEGANKAGFDPTAWALDKLGAHQSADWVRQHEYKDIYTGSPESFEDLEKKAGIGYEPQTPTEAAIKKYTAAGTTGAIGGVVAGGLGGVGALTPEMGTAIGNGAITGAGGIAGGEAGKGVNSILRQKAGLTIPDSVAEALGSLLGSFGAGAAANRSILYEKPQIVKDYEAAGVKPHLFSDVGNEGTTANAVDALPNVSGAKGLSRSNAASTQSQIRDYGYEVLKPQDQTIQQQGELLQQKAQASKDIMRQQIGDAFDKVEKLVDPKMPVDLTNTKAAIGNLVNKATTPEAKQIVESPAFQKFGPIQSVDTMPWSDVDAIRQRVGEMIQESDGTDLGLLKRTYRALLTDMRSATMGSNPDWLPAYDQAAKIAEENNDKIRGVLQVIGNRDSPETLPPWMTQQAKAGGTRLNDVFSTPGFTPEDQGMFGKWFLGNAAMNNGSFDLDRVVRFWRAASPEAKAAIALDPEVEQGMQRLQRMYDATADSRQLATAPKYGGSGGSSLTDKALSLVTAAPAWAAGKVAQNPSVVQRMGTPAIGSMVTAPQKLAGAAVGMIPEVYAPNYSDASSGAGFDWNLNHHIAGNGTSPYYPVHGGEEGVTQNAEWLGSADRATATSYIASRLGPLAAAQLPTDPAGYKAALWSLMAKPDTRAALFGGAPQPPPQDVATDPNIPTITVTPGQQ